MVCLIKPQFETTKEKVGKKGVVRDPEVHKEVIEKVIDFCLKIGFSIEGLDYSPIKGPEGNIEYLLLIRKTDDNNIDEDKALLFKDYVYENDLKGFSEIIDKVVKESHTEHSI